MFDIITIAGSPSGISRSTAVLEYARRRIERYGLRTHMLSICNLPPDDLIYGRLDSPAVAEWTELLLAARGVVIATPIYKASFSGVLKNFLDLLPAHVLDGKPVLPIATGKSPAHVLAIDYTLQPMIAALGAQDILPGIYLLESQVQLVGDSLQIEATSARRLDSALLHLADMLLSVDALAQAR